MPPEILTNAQCYAADRYAEHGIAPPELMENAGRAVADAIVRRYAPRRVLVACGPGNNGGDGFVAARYLSERGWDVSVAMLETASPLPENAALMAARWNKPILPLSTGLLDEAELIVVALFGAGLARPIEGLAKEFVRSANARQVPIVAVDLPSGLEGDTGKPAGGGECVKANLTVSFFRAKPAHVLLPGREFCGDIEIADIGIPDSALAAIAPNIFENSPQLWMNAFPWPGASSHKYQRGHALIVSGPAHATGAARLAARGALRAGAGLVSIASPPDAVPINAAHLTAIMIKPFVGADGLAGLLRDRRLNAVAIGPGCGVGLGTADMVRAVLKSEAAAVLDADALTSFGDTADDLFAQLRKSAVITPHAGEFDRLFPGLLGRSPSRIDAVRSAAAAAGCTVVLKGADTAICDPDGRVAINTNAPPSLATAGSGDVLAGMVCGLLAQGMKPFDAACAAVWLHGEAAALFGPGLVSEDLPEMLPAVLRTLKRDGVSGRHS